MRQFPICLALLLATALGAAEGPEQADAAGEAAPGKTAAEAPADPQAEPKPYPLQTCIVSGEKLGSMGEAVSLVHAGQEVKFCCKSCIRKFKQDPAKHLAKLEPAKQQAEEGASAPAPAE